VGDHVGIGVLLGAVEGAKLAVDVADVGVVDVAVDDVGDDLVPASVEGLRARKFPAMVGQCTKLLKRQAVKFNASSGVMRSPSMTGSVRLSATAVGIRKRLKAKG